MDTKAQGEYSSTTVAKRSSPSKECVESQARGSAELVKRMFTNHKTIINPSQYAECPVSWSRVVYGGRQKEASDKGDGHTSQSNMKE